MTETSENAASSKERQYIVGIGASAGGLEALVSFFSALPSDSGMAFVVVQHLSPDHKSLMADLLAKHTAMPVQHADDGMPVQPNQVYLIPPRKDITIYHGSLFLAEQDRSVGCINFPIDLFFDSLAKDKGDEAIAIILSGTGSDGTRSIGGVKSEGGLVLVQDPETAQYGGMPRSAIRTGLVDRVLAPEEMPEALLQFIEAPRRTREALEANKHHLEKGDGYEKIYSRLRHRFSLDFSMYKPTTVTRRIEHRMNIHQLASVEDYVQYLDEHQHELPLLYRGLLIHVTRFFRDPEAFEVLKERVIFRLVDAAIDRQVGAVRVWVAGCSTGEEAYSIAMLFHECLQEREEDVELKIFATDIDQNAINRAATGAYPESIVADLSPERLRAFFVKTGTQYQVTPELRKSVIFAPHNLIKDPPFSKLDLVTCRNLLIYLKRETQERVFTNFNYALREKGFLFLGSSETVAVEGLGFSTIDSKHRIYQQQRSLSVRPHAQPDALAYQSNDLNREAERSTAALPTKLVDTLFRDLLDEYVPAGVLINAKNDVLHVFGNVNQYLRVPAGEANMDLLKMVRSDIRILVGTALHRAKKEGKRVVYRDVAIGEDEKSDRFDLIINIVDPKRKEGVFLVLFDAVSTEAKRHFPETAPSYDLEEEAQERIQDLSRKLRYTEENLQATVEELETSNEELQATNEELMAANEELQSTNEELHSVNEELVTVNAELQGKIRQLTELNSDMDNLLQSTEVSTIFLDTELRIRKFTSSAAAYVNLMPSDEGRPIHHFAHIFDDIDLQSCAHDVLENGAPIEREVQGEAGKWYRFRALPYWTADDVVKGVVLAFVDVTEVKELQDALAAERQRRQELEADSEPEGKSETEAGAMSATANANPSTDAKEV